MKTLNLKAESFDFSSEFDELESTEFSATRRVRASPVPGAAVRG